MRASYRFSENRRNSPGAALAFDLARRSSLPFDHAVLTAQAAGAGFLGGRFLRGGLRNGGFLRSGLLRSGLLRSGLLGGGFLRSGLLGAAFFGAAFLGRPSSERPSWPRPSCRWPSCPWSCLTVFFTAAFFAAGLAGFLRGFFPICRVSFPVVRKNFWLNHTPFCLPCLRVRTGSLARKKPVEWPHLRTIGLLLHPIGRRNDRFASFPQSLFSSSCALDVKMKISYRQIF